MRRLEVSNKIKIAERKEWKKGVIIMGKQNNKIVTIRKVM